MKRTNGTRCEGCEWGQPISSRTTCNITSFANYGPPHNLPRPRQRNPPSPLFRPAPLLRRPRSLPRPAPMRLLGVGPRLGFGLGGLLLARRPPVAAASAAARRPRAPARRTTAGSCALRAEWRTEPVEEVVFGERGASWPRAACPDLSPGARHAAGRFRCLGAFPARACVVSPLPSPHLAAAPCSPVLLPPCPAPPVRQSATSTPPTP